MDNLQFQVLQNVIYHASYYSLAKVNDAKRQLKKLGYDVDAKNPSVAYQQYIAYAKSKNYQQYIAYAKSKNFQPLSQPAFIAMQKAGFLK